jgi:hypothetical protein
MESDWVREMKKKIPDADRRFAEFITAHQASCGDKAEVNFSGTDEVTILKCHQCGKSIDADISMRMYMDYLEKFRGAEIGETRKTPFAPGGKLPS